jgi:hypothetical protein
MNYKGIIIEESLEDGGVLKSIKIIGTKVEKVTKRDKTPWIKQWTLHTVEIPESKAQEIADKISKALDSKHSWYADFKTKKRHLIIFKNKVFDIDRTKADDYEKARNYGIKLGIPEYQLDFSEEIIV